MTNVLSVIHAPNWGGVHVLQARVASVLRRRGFRKIVVVPSGSDNGAKRLRISDLTVCEIPLHRIRRSLDLRVQYGFFSSIRSDIDGLRSLIREHAIEVVEICGLIHFHGALAARAEKVPVVWGLHGTSPPMALRLLFMPLVRRYADALLTSGTKVAEAHPGAGSFGDRIFPFCSPVDPTEFRTDPVSRARGRRLLEVPPDAIVVGTVGNRSRYKNHRLLVKAAARLIRTNPRVYLRIVGDEVPSNVARYKRHVLAEADRVNLLSGGRVGFVVPEFGVSAYLPGFDIFALTSIAEGGAIVVLEAMAAGLPVVSTDVGSVSDYVISDDTGILVGGFAPNAFASALARLAESETLRAGMGAQGHRRAMESFSVEACADAHVSAYRSAIARNPGRFTS